MLGSVDRRRSLEDLEGERWGPPPPDATRLVTVAYQLRRKPVGELAAEDLRLLIGQQVGLAVLVPLAIEHLQQDPLAEGDFYAGDLLHAVLGIDPDFWARHPALATDLDRLLASLTDPPTLLIADIERFKCHR